MTVDTLQSMAMIVILAGMSFLFWYFRRLMKEVRAGIRSVTVLTADHQGTAELFADSVRQLGELREATNSENAS